LKSAINTILAHPASIDSIPTSADKEDPVSMGTIAARKGGYWKECRAYFCCGIALGHPGLGFLLPLRPGTSIKKAYRVVGERVPPIKGDQRFSEDIKKIPLLIESGELINRVEKVVGTLE
jgi:histidine ammonia-lyase